jgi:hypothetical protein
VEIRACRRRVRWCGISRTRCEGFVDVTVLIPPFEFRSLLLLRTSLTSDDDGGIDVVLTEIVVIFRKTGAWEIFAEDYR